MKNDQISELKNVAHIVKQ